MCAFFELMCVLVTSVCVCVCVCVCVHEHTYIWCACVCTLMYTYTRLFSRALSGFNVCENVFISIHMCF